MPCGMTSFAMDWDGRDTSNNVVNFHDSSYGGGVHQAMKKVFAFNNGRRRQNEQRK